jgi:hypothetical protein
MEPSVAAGRFASETQDEFAEGILAEGQAYVHEVDVFVTFCMRILDSVPDGDIVRM